MSIFWYIAYVHAEALVMTSCVNKHALTLCRTLKTSCYASSTLNKAYSEYLWTTCTDRKLTPLKHSIRESQLPADLMRQRLKGNLNLMRPWSCWRMEYELMLQGATSSSRCFYLLFELPLTPFHLNYCYDCTSFQFTPPSPSTPIIFPLLTPSVATWRSKSHSSNQSSWRCI